MLGREVRAGVLQAALGLAGQCAGVEGGPRRGGGEGRGGGGGRREQGEGRGRGGEGGGKARPDMREPGRKGGEADDDVRRQGLWQAGRRGRAAILRRRRSRRMRRGEREVGRASSQPMELVTLSSLGETKGSLGAYVHGKEKVGVKVVSTRGSFELHHPSLPPPRCGSPTPPSRGRPACSASLACSGQSACLGEVQVRRCRRSPSPWNG